MKVISIDFENEVGTLDRQKFKAHVRDVTEKDLRNDINCAIDILSDMLNFIDRDNFDCQRDKATLIEKHKKLLRTTKDIPNAIYRNEYVLKLIDTF